MTPHAHRRSLRIPLWTVQLAGLILSAAIVAFFFWLGLAWFLGLGTYIESLP